MQYIYLLVIKTQDMEERLPFLNDNEALDCLGEQFPELNEVAWIDTTSTEKLWAHIKKVYAQNNIHIAMYRSPRWEKYV